MRLLQEAEEKSRRLLCAVLSRPLPDRLPRELRPGCGGDDAARRLAFCRLHYLLPAQDPQSGGEGGCRSGILLTVSRIIFSAGYPFLVSASILSGVLLYGACQ